MVDASSVSTARSLERHREGIGRPGRCRSGPPLNELHDLPLGEAVVAPAGVDVGLLSALHFFHRLLRFNCVEGRQASEGGVQVVAQAKDVDLFIEGIIEVLFRCPPLM
jgi:hypothetical protein